MPWWKRGNNFTPLFLFCSCRPTYETRTRARHACECKVRELCVCVCQCVFGVRCAWAVFHWIVRARNGKVRKNVQKIRCRHFLFIPERRSHETGAGAHAFADFCVFRRSFFSLFFSWMQIDAYISNEIIRIHIRSVVFATACHISANACFVGLTDVDRRVNVSLIYLFSFSLKIARQPIYA